MFRKSELRVVFENVLCRLSGGTQDVQVFGQIGDLQFGKTVLAGTEEIPGTAQLQIGLGDLKAVDRPAHHGQTLRGNIALPRVEQDAVGTSLTGSAPCP